MSRPHITRVADLMSTALPTVAETTPALDVARRMDAEQLRYVFVEAGGQLRGLVDRAALVRHVLAHVQNPQPDRPISSFMLPDPVTIDAQATAEEAIRLMHRSGAGALPVFDEGRLVGLLSERRLMPAAETVMTRLSRPHPTPEPSWETST